MTSYYNQVKEFHACFDPVAHDKVTTLSSEQADYRAGFKVEELLEFLYAANAGNDVCFDRSVEILKEQIDQQAVKIKTSKKQVDVLTGEVDALIDLLYFTYGSFVMMHIDPSPIFDIVHAANMGKLFPDGTPHYHPVTGKVLKPDNWETDCAPEEKIRKEINRQMNKK